jgi:ribosomal-protein-alanine N-acetyltransferase
VALHTERLVVRPLCMADLLDCHRLFKDIGWSDRNLIDEENLARRESWLKWTIDSYRELARLHQPIFGERAVISRAAGDFIGLTGYVPCLAPFGRMEAFGARDTDKRSLALGLFWAISPEFQRQGYASEAAGAMIGHAFGTMRCERIVATTEHDNEPSVGVMRRIGMTVHKHGGGEPGFRVVGVLRVEDFSALT